MIDRNEFSISYVMIASFSDKIKNLWDIMDDDFDHRMELRRQRREQMRQEAQK